MSKRDCWLSFSITPVQSFIEAARTVRDLKTGSVLLCYLVYKAIETGWQADGELLFPALHKGQAENIPNQFVMTFESDNQAHKAAETIKQAVQQSWKTLADKVHGLLDAQWGSMEPNWNQGWDDQIENFWDIRTIVLCPGSDDESIYRDLFHIPPDRTVEPLKQQWDLLAAALNAAKQVRHFPGDQGIGRHKCTIMGDLEQMGPGGSVGKQGQFWTTKAKGFVKQGICIGLQDRLCAVSLVKRFAPVIAGHPLNQLCDEVPDTAAIATAAWRQEAVAKGFQQELDHFQNAAKLLRRLIGDEADTPGRYLLDEHLTKKTILNQLSDAEQNQKQQQIEEAIENIKTTRSLLRQKTKNVGMDQPPRYYAILELDGDHIGKRLSGAYCEPGELTEAFYAEMSQGLRNCAEQDVPRIVQCHHGYLVYSGGDDVLALVPLSETLSCAQILRKVFPSLPGSRKPVTASIGIVVCHYMHDLRDALRQTRAAIERAKELGRDACGIHLLKRSGGDIRIVLSWDLLRTVSDLVTQFRAGGSDRWATRLAEITPAVSNYTAHEAQMQLLITHFLQRTEGGDRAVRESVIDLAQQAWTLTWQFLHERHTELKRDGRTQYPTKEESGFWGDALRVYLDTVKIASFLARGRE